jgi:DNA repair exonuclease SbcCD ATPase subunit
MKTPLFAIACAGIGAAGIFSYMQIAKHQEELDLTNAKKNKTANVEETIQEQQNVYDLEKDNKEQAEEELSATKAEIELKGGNVTDKLNTELASVKNKITTQENQIKEFSELFDRVQDAFKGENVELDEISSFINKLDKELKKLETESEEITLAVEETQKEMDTNKVKLAGLQKRENDRIKSISQNSISSRITAVDRNWGFVIIKPHTNAVINSDSQLIIVRGAQHIGKLNIDAVEANRVIADIDIESLVSGASVRVGDQVILAKANRQ